MDGEERGLSPDGEAPGCSMAKEVLLARMISMIMPLQSQQILISGPLLAWLGEAPLATDGECFFVGSVMDWERCKGRFPFCWSRTDALPRMAVGDAVEVVVLVAPVVDDGFDGDAEDLQTSEK